MKTKVILTAGATLAFAIASFAEKANDVLSITTVPPDVQVEMNRKVIGRTPLEKQIGEYAFNSRKTFIFSKRLAQPIVLRLSKEGYIPQEITITHPMTATSLNGQNHWSFYIIDSNYINVKLDKIEGRPDQPRIPTPTESAPTSIQLQPPAPIPTAVRKPASWVTVGTITDNNGSICHYVWKVSINNDTDQELTFAGTVSLVDRDGRSVDSSEVVGLRVPAHLEKEFSGSKMMMVDSALTVVKAVAQLSER
jgi:hypothetical protein